MGETPRSLLNCQKNLIVGMYTAETCPDTIRTTVWFFVLIAFVHPIANAGGYVGEYMDRRYWPSQFIPSGIYPYTVPFFFIVEAMVATFANVGCICMLLNPIIYFTTTNAWMKLLM